MDSQAVMKAEPTSPLPINLKAIADHVASGHMNMFLLENPQ